MSKTRDIEALAAAVCDGSADDAIMDQLAEILRDDPAAQQQYLAYVDLHNSLRWMAQGDAVAGAVRTMKEAGVSAPVRKPQPLRVIAYVLAAAAALAMAFLWGNRNAKQPPPQEGISVVAVLPEGPKSEVISAMPVGEVWASVADVGNALWVQGGLESPNELRDGAIELHEGILRLELASGGEVVAEAPAVFSFSSDEGFELQQGAVVCKMPSAQSLKVSGGTICTQVAKSVFGLSVSEDMTVAGVLSGQTRVMVSKPVTGRVERVSLAREESVRALAGGGMLRDIVGDVGSFRDLQAAVLDDDRLVANSGFEYPVMETGASDVAAAGWSFQVLPLMNASEMPRDDAVGMLAATARSGLVPPEGDQWAFLGARRLADGRYFHAAMHQRIEPLQRGVTYRLEMTVAADKRATQPARYLIGLYAGQPESVPDTVLQATRGAVQPNGTETIVVRYRSPNSNLYAGLHLFVRAELLPPDGDATAKLFIDNVKLEIESGEPVE